MRGAQELTMEKTKKLAQYEIGWWKAHHRKDKKEFVDNMCKLYSLQFGISHDQAKQAVLFRVEAADWHDKAEEYEDKGDQAQADVYWNKAEECLYQHFKLLENR